MDECAEVFAGLAAGISEAEQLKLEVDSARDELRSDAEKLPLSMANLAASCAGAVLGPNPATVANCAADLLKGADALNDVRESTNNLAARNKAFNDKVEENHELLNSFCYCLALGVEAIELGTEFENLEEQLEALEDEVSATTDPDELEALEDEIGDVLDDLEFFDQLLDDLREEIEQEFGG